MIVELPHPVKGRSRAPCRKSDDYAEFIASAVQAILHAEYTPARSGGCPVRQMIRQRVSFKIGQRLPGGTPAFSGVLR